jgi:hypothetical protein
MQGLGSFGIGLVWAIGLCVFAVGLNYALHGWAYCSLRRLWGLGAAAHVVRRLEKTDRIRSDGKRLCFSPRAASGRPDLCFAPDIDGLPRGAYAREIWLEFIHGQMLRRGAVFTAVVAGFALAWFALTAPGPGAIENFVARLEGKAPLSIGGLIFAALAFLSALFAIHTFYPFRFSILPQFGLSPAPKKADAPDSPSDGAAPESKDQKSKTSEGFIGSEETLSDLDRFCALVRKVLGPRNENVFAAYYYRSFTLFHLKRFEGALADIEHYADAQLRALGKRNRWVLKVRYLRSVVLAFLGKWPQALTELDSLAPLQAEALGASHPETLTTRSARVTAWSASDRHGEVLRELDTLLPDLAHAFGPEHPFTRSNAHLQAIALEKVGGTQKDFAKVEPVAMSSMPSTAPKSAVRPQAVPPPAPQPGWRNPVDRRLLARAGAVLVGLAILVGAGFAAPWVWRNFSAVRAPGYEVSVEASDAVAIPLPVPEDGLSSEDLRPDAPGFEDEEASAAAPFGDAALIMIAGKDGANVRTAPATDAALIVRLDPGANLRVTGRTETSGQAWYSVVLPDRRSGFVRGDVVVRNAAELPLPAVENYAPAAPISAGRDGANVRAAPRSGAPVVARLEAGTALQVTGRAEAFGHSWFRVVLPDRRIGFVRGDVIEQVQQAQVAQPLPPDGSAWIDMASISWRRRATRAEMTAAYPAQQWTRATALVVELQCKAAAGGRLADCSILGEAPTVDVGAAALRIIRYYRIDPILSDGTRADGRWLRLRVRFDPPPPPEQ